MTMGLDIFACIEFLTRHGSSGDARVSPVFSRGTGKLPMSIELQVNMKTLPSRPQAIERIRRFIVTLNSILVFGAVAECNGETLRRELIIVGLPTLSNGWWLNEVDSREVLQNWGGLEEYSENPPGGLIYKVERDLNGDGVEEVILRWTIVGNTWDVYQKNEGGNLIKTGSLGGVKTLHIVTKEDGSSSFRNYQFGPNRDAIIYEYAISKDLKIAYSELEHYPSENDQISADVQSRFANDKILYLGATTQLKVKKALMLSLLYDFADPWEEADGAIGGSAHWNSPEMHSQLRTLESQGKTKFAVSRAQLIRKLGDDFNPEIPTSDIRLMSISPNGVIEKAAFDDILRGNGGPIGTAFQGQFDSQTKERRQVNQVIRLLSIVAGFLILGVLLLFVNIRRKRRQGLR